jgi:hypothetical protein
LRLQRKAVLWNGRTGSGSIERMAEVEAACEQIHILVNNVIMYAPALR